MKIFFIVLILFFSYDAYSQTAEDYFKSAYDKDENGDYYGAISDLNKAIELNPDYAMAYLNRGFAKSNLKDHYGAISDYNKSIELDPDYPIAYNNRGLAKLILGQKYSGCLDLSKAGELGYESAYYAIKQFCN